jgi:hypothetical protein
VLVLMLMLVLVLMQVLLVVRLVQHYPIPAKEVMAAVSMMRPTYQPLLAIECV